MKAHLSRTVPQGEEKEYLEEARRELRLAQEEIARLTKERTKLSREISVRQRKLGDWKGKIPRGDIEPPTRALQRAGKMPWTCIADLDGSSITIRKEYKRAIEGLRGFSHIWIVSVCGEKLGIGAHAVHSIDEKVGTIVLKDYSFCTDGVIVDIKPYLSYCDVWQECDSNVQ